MLDTGSQVGVASVLLVVVLTVLGAWAERGREKKMAGPRRMSALGPVPGGLLRRR